MLHILMSDFYKLFHRKAFYISLLAAFLLAALGIYMIPINIKQQYNIPLETELDFKMFGYNALFVFVQGVGSSMMPMAVLLSLFISYDFSAGIFKNVVVRGISRTKIYISKFLTVVVSNLIFIIFSCLAAFIMAYQMWGLGEFKQEDFLKQLGFLGLYALVSSALYSFLTAITFLVKNMGGAIALNLVLTVFAVPALVLSYMSYLLRSWFNVIIDLSNYWIGSLINQINPQSVGENLNFVLIVSFAYLIVGVVVGALCFEKQEIR